MLNIPRSIIIIQIVLLCVQAVLYFGIQILEGPAHNVETALDSKIPYFPPALFFYVLLFPGSFPVAVAVFLISPAFTSSCVAVYL